MFIKPPKVRSERMTGLFCDSGVRISRTYINNEFHAIAPVSFQRRQVVGVRRRHFRLAAFDGKKHFLIRTHPGQW